MSLPINIIKEKLSKRYVEAVASRAGFEISRDEFDTGDDLNIKEVDVRIEGGKTNYYPTSRFIFLQIKSTTIKQIKKQKGYIKYSLRAKNYNDLVYVNKKNKNTKTPKVLILFVLPNNIKNWLILNNNELILKKCAYWYTTESEIETTNKTNIKIKIPTDQIFNLDFFDFYINKYYI